MLKTKNANKLKKFKNIRKQVIFTYMAFKWIRNLKQFGYLWIEINILLQIKYSYNPIYIGFFSISIRFIFYFNRLINYISINYNFI